MHDDAKDREIAKLRLASSRLVGAPYRSPEEAVRAFGAVQSQDYAGAAWALGMRLDSATEVDVNRAFDEGRIVRTHVLRPTWHFVAPEDIRDLLELTGERVLRGSASMFRRYELDATSLARTGKVVERTLSRAGQCTRNELRDALSRAGFEVADGVRLGLIVMHAELTGLVCSGPRRGKQFTYALVDDRAGAARPFDRELALRELVRRYFTSHGPATVADFAWWSGLAGGDARRVLADGLAGLTSETSDGETRWFADDLVAPSESPVVRLLPNYDELFIALRDRSAQQIELRAADGAGAQPVGWRHAMSLDGQVVGGWTRTSTASTVTVTTSPIRALSRREASAFAAEASRLATFMGRALGR